eukprot:CAMPEP_0196584208 /NCGR_PEP_ID=MMETSP1081-20130531/46189_1 /TAXON_ID=36882 /ORGANISM="Pyramimonas amylifera, Strain CCMP720" /LENGTH=361 /DNA_ID=CAMNT_0041905341 /DNA_START=71 /DNA_END=1156 /DNA_ORIENTATION=-
MKTDATSRLDRVMDEKYRTIGVDKTMLNIQIQEQKDRDTYENSNNAKYDRLAEDLDKKMVMLEQERREIKREMNVENAQYWQAKQGKDKGLEWDLNDPDSLKKAIPARMGDEDPRLGISSVQQFGGEDLQAGERKKLQMDQQKSWCEQQNEERRQIAEAVASEDAGYLALTLAQAEHQKRVNDQEDQARRQMAERNTEMNLERAAEKADQKAEDHENEQRANHLDQYNTFNSALLTEHPGQAQHAANPMRKRMDHYKGMLPQEKQGVLDFQAEQREELKAKREAERQEEIKYAQYQHNLKRELTRKEADMEGFRAEQRKAVAATLIKQNAEKVDRDDHHNNILYTNVPNHKYFDQFGTSHR